MERLKKLLANMPKIAEAVNAFNSDVVQQEAFRILVESMGMPVDSAPGDDGLKRDQDERKDAGKAAKGKRKGKKGKREAKGKKSTKRTKMGPRTLLDTLIAEGFFTKPQTLNSIIQHAKQHKAKTFKANELSGTLARFVREDKLGRQKNANGQYEYKKKA